MNKGWLFITGVFVLLIPLAGVGQSLQLADSLFAKGKRFDDSGQKKQSEFYYREAYNIYREFQDTASWLEAGKQYASAMMWRSKHEKAIKLYKKLLEVDHPANDTYNRGDLYNSMGLASKRSGNMAQALQYYQKSLPLAKASGDSLLIGFVYNNLGGVYSARGHPKKALDYYKQTLPYLRSTNQKGTVAITIGNIGSIYRDLSLYKKALENFNKSLETQKEIGDIHSLANIYSKIGIVQSELGNYDQALISHKKSLEYSKKAGTPDQMANALNNIGLLYKRLGEYDKALDYYQQSLAIKKETSNPSSVATTTKNIGKLYWAQEQYQEAKPYYLEALELRRQIGNPRQVASSLNTMVEMALQNQNYVEAQEYTDEIMAIGDSTGSYKIMEYGTRYQAKIYSLQGQHANALKYYKQWNTYSKYLSPQSELSALKALAQQYHRIDSDSALSYGQKAINLIEQHRSNAGAVSELRSGYFGKHADFYNRMASWALKYDSDVGRAYRLVEQAKARSLSDELAKASQNIDQKLPEEVRIKRQKMRNKIDNLYTQLERNIDKQKRSELKEQLRTAELELAAYENSLQHKFPELKSLTSPEVISLEQAQAITDEQTAVLEYALADDHLIMFLINRNNIHVEQYSLPEEQELAKQLTSWVADFKDAILSNASRRQLRGQSKQLYDALIKPFEEEISQFENLIIVPDGALAYLPFEAISQGDQYLIENFRIKYEPSLTSLTLLKDPDPTSRKDLLAVAGSQVSAENERSYQSARLSALPSTVIEVDSIASHFKQVSTLKNEQVSEQAFKNLLQKNQYQYVHMATHGVIDEEQPGRSGLALSAEGEIKASSTEDGMLRSSEIFGLNINSDMVVLSACNTGLGKVVGGEGMLGMQRSFFYAGTSTVVVSLWNVYDRSTASFMNEFYKALLQAESEEGWTDSMLRWVGWDQSIPFGRKAVAMRQAKLEMIKHPLFNHPVYWAPFIVVGR